MNRHGLAFLLLHKEKLQQYTACVIIKRIKTTPKRRLFILDFELTRSENDETLLPQIDSIKTAENIQVLIPFAKAYLGMFYVIDKELPPKEKVKLLANKGLADAIFSGFLSCLNKVDLPTVEEIGHAMVDKKEFAEGYVVLAGLDLITRKSLTNINEINFDVIEKAVAFHFSNKKDSGNFWFDYLLEKQKQKIIPALCKYWVAVLKNNATYLPGRNLVLGENFDIEIAQQSILLLLENWTRCKEKILLELLHTAFKYSNANEFLVACENILDKDESLNERTRLYWIASAYLLSPEKYFSVLSNYVGRVKSKVMPLLDFVSLIMKDNGEINTNLNTKAAVQLLRMIAPVFPPQQHVYGAIGELDINSRNVMLMFYFLASSKEECVISEIKSLRKARVMKIYSAVIDNLLELQMRRINSEDFSFPSFNEYIETLVSTNCLQGRSNKFDLR